MNSEILVEQFCTPPEYQETDSDRKAFSKAAILDIEFEDRVLKAYSIGAGPNVLMVHGWGSRASHLALIARYIANKGFRVVVLDGPAHGNSKKMDCKDMSNMFEFGKAISCVAKKLGDVYAVLGHSLGAMASAFTMAGTGILSKYKFSAEKLILISSPISVIHVFDNYSRHRNESHLLTELTSSLENAYNFKAAEYELLLELHNVNSKVMIIHDEKDEEVPVFEAISLKNKYEDITLKLTSGYGHQKILINREILNSIKDFLML